MTLFSKLKTWRNRIQLRQRFSNSFWLDYFSRFPDLSQRVQERGGAGLFFSDFGLLANQKNSLLLLRSYQLLKELNKTTDLKLSEDLGQLRLKINGTSININDPEEFYIAHEVYSRNIYGWSFQRPSLVIDVGMNVGMSALYFAKSPLVHVVGFEAFPTTYEQACKNFGLNPAISSHITPKCLALADKAAVENWSYYPERKGSSGRFNMPNSDVAQPVQQVRVTMSDVDNEIRSLYEQHPNREIILKLDCEGGEHAILARLQETHALSQHVHAVMMEWHARTGHSWDDCRKCLETECFDLIANSGDTRETRLVYAINRKSSD